MQTKVESEEREEDESDPGKCGKLQLLQEALIELLHFIGLL